jgi:hypothetical protein
MFKWLFVTLVLALAIYLGMHDVLFKPKAPPVAPSTYETFNIKAFKTRSEAEDTCGKNNVMYSEEITPTESRDVYICSDQMIGNP